MAGVVAPSTGEQVCGVFGKQFKNAHWVMFLLINPLPICVISGIFGGHDISTHLNRYSVMFIFYSVSIVLTTSVINVLTLPHVNNKVLAK